MERTEELYHTIVREITRLSKLIYEENNLGNAKGMGILINYLAGILDGELDISDFHDKISEAPTQVREYYYKLLYLVK